MNKNTKQARKQGQSCLAQHHEGPGPIGGRTNTVTRTCDQVRKTGEGNPLYTGKRGPHDKPRYPGGGTPLEVQSMLLGRTRKPRNWEKIKAEWFTLAGRN